MSRPTKCVSRPKISPVCLLRSSHMSCPRSSAFPVSSMAVNVLMIYDDAGLTFFGGRNPPYIHGEKGYFFPSVTFFWIVFVFL